MDPVTYCSPIDAFLNIGKKDCLSVIPLIAKQCRGAIITSDEIPLSTLQEVNNLKKEIQKITILKNPYFSPFMTLNITPTTPIEEIVKGYGKEGKGLIVAVRISNKIGNNVLDLQEFTHIFKFLEKNQIPLYLNSLIKLSTTEENKGEKTFITYTLPAILDKFPRITLILENVSSKKIVKFVKNIPNSQWNIYAIITPQELFKENFEEIQDKIKNVSSSIHFRFCFGSNLTNTNRETVNNLVNLYIKFLTNCNIFHLRKPIIFSHFFFSNISNILKLEYTQNPSTS